MVFKYRPFAHLNILVLASWPSGIEGWLDMSGWQFDSWLGVLLRATFCSGALLRQPSHRVVLDPYSCQIQNRIAEMKKAKRLLLLQGVLFLVNTFECLSRWHERAVAQVRPVTISDVVRDITRRHPFRSVEEMDATYMSRTGAGVGSDSYPSWCGYVERASLKREAAQISRSESEVYTFLTNNTTSQEQAQQLLDIITNVSFTFFFIIAIIVINAIIVIICPSSASRHVILSIHLCAPWAILWRKLCY